MSALSYRSAIFYATEDQKRVAEDTIADVDASGIWPGKVVTEIAPAGPFWQAEPEHQDYLERYPNGYTCHSSCAAGVETAGARRGDAEDRFDGIRAAGQPAPFAELEETAAPRNAAGNLSVFSPITF